MKNRLRLGLGFALLALALGGTAASPRADLAALVKDFFAVPAVTGNEENLAHRVIQSLPAALATARDNLGSVYARFQEEATAPFLVAAPLDEFGYFVSGLTQDGYLRLDRAAAPPHPQFDAFLIGHAVVIATEGGLQNGVIVQPAMHVLSRELRDALQKPNLDNVYLDIGARTEDEIGARGISYLDTVSFRPELAELAGEKWAGPSLGQKSLCAALVSAADAVATEKNAAGAVFAWMAQTRFLTRGSGGRVGVGAVRTRTRLQPGSALVLDVVPADRGEGLPAFGMGLVLIQAKDEPSKLRAAVEAAARALEIPIQYRASGDSSLLNAFAGQGADAVALGLPVKFAQAPSEVIALEDVRALADLVSAVVKGGVR